MLETGMSVVIEKCFTQKDFDIFADLSGDDNPIHVDPVFSARTKFGKTVAHGMLLYSTLIAEVGRLFPGEGFVQHSQELMFPAPTFVDEHLKICLEAAGQPAPDLVELAVTVKRPDGELGCVGKTVVQVPGDVPRFADKDPEKPVPASDVLEHRGLRVGQTASLTHVFSGESGGSFHRLLELVGDQNRYFVEPYYARQHGLDNVILPGGVLGGLISNLLGTQLPGRGTNWLKQRYSFPKPAYPNQPLNAMVEIIRLRPEKELVNLRTTCTDLNGDLVLEGEALVWVSDLEGSG